MKGRGLYGHNQVCQEAKTLYIPYPWKGQTGFLNFVLPAIKRELSIPHTHTHIHSERQTDRDKIINLVFTNTATLVLTTP